MKKYIVIQNEVTNRIIIYKLITGSLLYYYYKSINLQDYKKGIQVHYYYSYIYDASTNNYYEKIFDNKEP